MGFSGKLIVYTTVDLPDPMGTARRLIDALDIEPLTGADGQKHPPGFVIWNLLRWERPDRSWALWREDPTSSRHIEETMAADHVSGPMTAEALESLMPVDGRMYIALWLSRLAKPLCEAAKEIPREIRGDYMLGSRAAITVGWHDIIDGYNEPFLVDRASLSVSFDTPMSPNDWDETRRRILALPELEALKAPLEEIAGPLKAWVKWG